MGGAKNWHKEYEESDKISWLHDGKFDFGLHADKKNRKWSLRLSTPTWPQEYDKKIIETETKKRVKSFAYDWRKSHTETRDLLREAEIWVDNTRKIFNPFNVSLVLMSLLLFLAMLQTWNFIGPVFGAVFLGIIMGAGGLVFLIEGFYSKGSLDVYAPVTYAENTVSLLTGSFAILTSYGYITGSQVYVTHFSGVQGGIFAFMFTYIMVQWLKNRLVRAAYLVFQWIKNWFSRVTRFVVRGLKNRLPR
ncbi:MAG: hypothetical protein MUP63_03500 [Candidatus Nanohaloarchaeota archaeon QJJ-7]|nr:hypothetical protein [Candidatus Nanohaloarchaeota archaeon QJJ-7]